MLVRGCCRETVVFFDRQCGTRLFFEVCGEGRKKAKKTVSCLYQLTVLRRLRESAGGDKTLVSHVKL